MIALINGKLVAKSTEAVVVDVGGIGYEVFIPLSTYTRLPELNQPVFLKVHTRLKEDAIQLWGFLTAGEKDTFELLISVSGIGPRAARNILSGISVAELLSAISAEDKTRLSSIPGIGSKSAERLIVELKDKVKTLAAHQASSGAGRVDLLSNDVVSALCNLGYKNSQAEEAVKKALSEAGASGMFEGLFKEALKRLSKK